MKDYVDQLKAKDPKAEGQIDEAPELVEDFEEVSNKNINFKYIIING